MFKTTVFPIHIAQRPPRIQGVYLADPKRTDVIEFPVVFACLNPLVACSDVTTDRYNGSISLEGTTAQRKEEMTSRSEIMNEIGTNEIIYKRNLKIEISK